jgi:hypothetical protein
MTTFTRILFPCAWLLALASGCGGRADEAADSGTSQTTLSPAPLGGYSAGTLAAVGVGGASVSVFPGGVPDAGLGYPPPFSLNLGPTQEDAMSRIAFGPDRRLYVELYQAVPSEPAGLIAVFPSGAFGSMSPVRVVSGPSLGASAYLTGLAVGADGNIYVLRNGGDQPTSAVLVFGPGSDSTPVRTIMGDQTQLSYPSGLAVDAAGQVYVGSDGPSAVMTFAAGADGNVAPISTLQAPQGMGGTEGVAVDASGRVYVTVTVPPGVVVFNGGAVERTISGAATGLASPIDVAVDARGRIFVSDYATSSSGSGDVRVFAPGATGDVAPEEVLLNVEGIGAAVVP